MSLTNVLLLLVAVAATNAKNVPVQKSCSGTVTVPPVDVADTYVIDNECGGNTGGNTQYHFTIGDKTDVYRAFNVKLMTTNTSIERKGVMVKIDQYMDEGGDSKNFLNCKGDNETSCEMLVAAEGVTTYTYRTMVITIVTPASEMKNITLAVTAMSTNLTTTTVDLNTVKDKYQIMPSSFEYTTQGFMITAHKDTSSNKFTSMFTLVAGECYLNDDTNMLKMHNNGNTGKVLMDYNKCPTKVAEFTENVYLEYMRIGVPMKNGTWMGETSTTSVKSATRSGLSLVAVLAVIVYQMMVKQY